MEFYGATMQDVAFRMQFSFGSDGPVRDRTGLIGRYDFRAFRVSALGEDTGFEYVIPGLEFKRSTEKGTILVIDHLEKPTAN